MSVPLPVQLPDKHGRFGRFGGCYVPETLVPALHELERGFAAALKDKGWMKEFRRLLADFVGRPTPLTFAGKLSSTLGRKVYLKREDLCHTGAHKINNALGQVLLAKKLGKTRHCIPSRAQAVAVATPCCPAPVSAMMRDLPNFLASSTCPKALLILCAPVWQRSSRFR